MWYNHIIHVSRVSLELWLPSLPFGSVVTYMEHSYAVMFILQENASVNGVHETLITLQNFMITEYILYSYYYMNIPIRICILFPNCIQYPAFEEDVFFCYSYLVMHLIMCYLYHPWRSYGNYF